MVCRELASSGPTSEATAAQVSPCEIGSPAMAANASPCAIASSETLKPAKAS